MRRTTLPIVVLGTALGLTVLTACGGSAQTGEISEAQDAVHIEAISPSSGTIGAEVVIQGYGFAPPGNDIAFSHSGGQTGQGSTGHLTAVPSPDGKTLRFELPDTLGACALSQLGPNVACPAIGLMLPVGEIDVSVLNRNGVSNSVAFTREVSPIEAAQAEVNASPALHELTEMLNEMVRASYQPASGLHLVSYGFGFRESEDGRVYIELGIHGVDVSKLDIPTQIEGYEVRLP